MSLVHSDNQAAQRLVEGSAGTSDRPLGGLAVLAATDTAAGTPAHRSWPRQFLTGRGSDVTIYKPHIDTLTSGVVTGRIALSMGKKGETTARPGVATFTARLSVDRVANLVTLIAVKVDRICFPPSPPPRWPSTPPVALDLGAQPDIQPPGR